MVAQAQGPRGGRIAPRAPRNPRRYVGKDRDGDVSMGVSAVAKGGIAKPKPVASTSKDVSSRLSRKEGRPRVLTSGAKNAILKHVGGSDGSMNVARTLPPRRDDVDLRITGWEKSKIASHSDGGVGSLIQWLEKKASIRLGSRKTNVKIIKKSVEGDTLFITVRPGDAPTFLRMNGYKWCDTNINIEYAGSAPSAESTTTADTKEMLRGVLENRYNPETKLLDLSALHLDEALRAKHVFDSKSTTGKIFPALMRVLELCFDTAEERHAAIESVSLANNDLPDLKMVSTLSETLPRLHNLDLSNNNFESLSALHSWRRRFSQLQQLILSGNPIEQKEPSYPAEIIKWYRNLRTLNGIQVRTEEEIAAGTSAPELPFPIRSPLFQDENGIAENLIRTFFVGFDTDRSQLASLYYDDHSDFSFAVNTMAPRDPSGVNPTEKQEWDQYIKNSRNLKKITHLPARQNRLFRGTQAVKDVFAKLPITKHPDLALEARKWMIEAHIQPGVPDPTGQSPNGVDGFMICVHGEFDELDAPNGHPNKKRSFDRTFIIGPGGPSGVRIVNDVLTIRAYGGAQAFDPDNFEPWQYGSSQQQQQSTVNIEGAPQLPAGLTVELAEQMVVELQKQTSMTLEYAKDCLDQVGWDFERALLAFTSVKASLPPAAFVQAA